MFANRNCVGGRQTGRKVRSPRAYTSGVIVDSAIYVDGRRAAETGSLEETYEACRTQKGVAWIGLYKPTADVFPPLT